MKKIRLSAVFIAALFIAAGCAGSPAVTGLMSFDEAIAGATASVENEVTIGAEIAISKIDSPLSSLSDFLSDELNSRFSANKKLVVLARGKALESVDKEHTVQMSGMVSDESAVSIGHRLGAKVVITGTFDRFGNFSQLSIRAIEVETGRVLTYRARIANNDVILASVTKPLKTIKPVVIKENALDHLNRGKDLYAEGEYDAAIAEFDKALAINAKLSEAFYYRGLAYYHKGLAVRWEAMEAMNARMEAGLDPFDVDDDYDRAIADYNDRAIVDFTAALRIDPNYADALNNRGNVYLWKGDYDRAIEDYTAALRIDPNNASVLNTRGYVYSIKGNVDVGYSVFKTVWRIDPNKASALNTRDNEYLINRAIEDYTVALRIDPNDAYTLNTRGSAYYYKGDYDRAIEDYTAALRIDPNDAYTLNTRGGAYYYKGDYDRAIADYTAILRIDPNDASAYYNRGVAYGSKGDYDRAIADYTAALKINPNDASVLNNRGNAYYMKKDYRQAIIDYTQTLKLNPNHTEAKKWLEEARKQ